MCADLTDEGAVYRFRHDRPPLAHDPQSTNASRRFAWPARRARAFRGGVKVTENAASRRRAIASATCTNCSSHRWRSVERVVKSEPVLLYRSGFLLGPMRQARVTEDEGPGGGRGVGHGVPGRCRGRVLETDGTLSVLPSAPDLDP